MRAYAAECEFGDRRPITLRTPACRLHAGETAAARDLKDVHTVFRTRLGQSYDTDVLDAVLAAAANHWLPGDPLWLLVVAASGDAKTETVCSLQHIKNIPVTVVGSITSAGALLTGLGKKDQDAGATVCIPAIMSGHSGHRDHRFRAS